MDLLWMSRSFRRSESGRGRGDVSESFLPTSRGGNTGSCDLCVKVVSLRKRS